MMKRSRKPRQVRDLAQQGSGYLMTLLVLSVITIIGLSVSLTMQTERQLSSAERSSQETFYAADSGTAVSIARSIWDNRQDTFSFMMNRRRLPRTGAQHWTGDQVCVSALRQLSVTRCNWCASEEGASFHTINQAVLGYAERWVWTGTETPPPTAEPRARRSVSKMMAVQPWAVQVDTSVFDTTGLVSADGSLIEGDCSLRY